MTSPLYSKICQIKWNSTNRLLSDFIGLLLSKNFATMATWHNDFSSLLHSQIDKYYVEYFARM